MKINVLRQKGPDTEPYWESFDYGGARDLSVAGLLDYLNFSDDIINDKGERTTRIAWDCSCLQGICGACAMVINGTPALACETFLKDLEGDEITLQPFRKFPVIHDLVIDRTSIHENLKQMDIYIGEYQPREGKDRTRQKEHFHQYEIAKCLKCGICLEVCPNYTTGSSFFGAVFANDCYLVYARNRKRSQGVRKIYAEHFAKSCSKSLSCMDVCPMNLPTIASMAKLNR